MKKYNVYTHYDNTHTVIGKVIPNYNHLNERFEISARTYNRLLSKRTIGGIAGIYTDAPFEIDVVNNKGYVVDFVR